MHELNNILGSLDKTLANLHIADYEVWEKVSSILSKYCDVSDGDWGIVSVSEHKIIVETNPINAYLYSYDSDMILNELSTQGLLFDTIVFKVKKSTIV